MPTTIDINEVNQIYKAYLQHGSMSKTAIALGIPRYKVVKSVYRATGRCQCGRTPAEGYVTCQKCLDRATNGSKKRRAMRAKQKVCRECGSPLDKSSTSFCTAHLLKNREKTRTLRHKRIDNGLCQFCNEPAVDGRPLCEKHIAYAFQKGVEFRSRNYFGGLLLDVLDRDYSTCQICGNADKVEVHHILGRKNSMENLITLCVYCHKAVTFLNHCSEPDKTYAFFLSHRPND